MYDVAIIGGGVSGTSLLYALSKYQVKAVLLEKENDVGIATTKANSAIVHAGFDPEPNTLMAKYNVRGNSILHELCPRLDILFKNTGSLVIAYNKQDQNHIQQLYERGIQNQVPGLRIVEKEELFQMEPNLNPEALSGLYAPSAGVINPWELASAQAENAILGGCEVLLSAKVETIEKKEDIFYIKTANKTIQAKFVVNATGINAEDVTSMVESPDFKIYPNRGQYYLLDTTQGNLVNHVVFQCPTKFGKGVLIAPTVHGNLIVGPNAEPATSVDTTWEGLAEVKSSALKSVPNIMFSESIRNFAGLRALSDIDDFIIGESKQTPGFFQISGIKSPGLTAAPAIAEDVVLMLEKAGLQLTPNPKFKSTRSILRFKHLTPEKAAQAIEENPLYGQIICRCSTVTEGEIVDTLHRPLPPQSLDAVKRRCATGMGRCQGGFCGPKIQSIIARELGKEQQQVPLDRNGMNIIIGKTKDAHLWETENADEQTQ